MVTLPLEHRSASAWQVLRRVDLVLVAGSLLLALLGVVMVYSATRDKLVQAGYNPHYYLDRQAEFVVIGVVVMLAVALFDYRWFEPINGVLYVGIILALLATFLVGRSQLGATRWIPIGPLQFQPSSFAVLAEIVVAGSFCARRPDGLPAGDLVRVIGLLLPPILLVVKQPDLGSGIIMCIVLVVILAVAGVANRYLLLMVVVAVVGAFGMIHFGLLKHYQVARITSFLQQGKGGETAAYNLQQSKAAIGSGGFWGTGLFHGLQTNNAYVPEQQTDFIFSAVGEQLGFAGAASTIALIGVVCYRLLRAAQRAREPFGRLVCAGAFAFIAFSAFENAGMTMGIMPIAGIPLPFLSYGGSAIITFFTAVGLALSVGLHQR